MECPRNKLIPSRNTRKAANATSQAKVGRVAPRAPLEGGMICETTPVPMKVFRQPDPCADPRRARSDAPHPVAHSPYASMCSKRKNWWFVPVRLVVAVAIPFVLKTPSPLSAKVDKRSEDDCTA